MRTGVITFGPDSEAVYRQFYGKGKMTKILRLLEPGEPKPEFFFSYQAQIFPCPKKPEDSEPSGMDGNRFIRKMGRSLAV